MFARALVMIVALAGLWADFGPTATVTGATIDCAALLKKVSTIVSCPKMQNISKFFPTCKCGSCGSISRLEVTYNGKTSSLDLCKNCPGTQIPIPSSNCGSFINKSLLDYFSSYLSAKCPGITFYTCATKVVPTGVPPTLTPTGVPSTLAPTVTATLPPNPEPTGTDDDWINI